VAEVNTHACDTDLLDTPSKRVVMGAAFETKYVRLQSG
jgi:hypothetical protein